MTRDLTPGMQTAIDGSDIYVIALFEGEFDGGFVRLWTGFGNITWDGKTWVGGGNLIGIPDVEENAELVATGITVSLAGVDPALVSAVIGSIRQNMIGRVWIGALSSSGSIISDPYLVFRGLSDVPTISDTRDGAVISITYENIVAGIQRPREIRFTDEAQKALYPDDRGFEYVTKIQDKDIPWTRN